ncbi:membrane bound O-acyl transferase family-domain-containing protein [Xylariaceae sp. FL1651]|nr:membrane bound O-acyl transferase family-domain-containing protein [Xylariaceae sp. FL1651]
MSPLGSASGILGLQVITTSTIVGFTRPSSVYRSAGLPISALLVYTQLSHIDSLKHPIGRSFLGAASVFLAILYIDVALLSRWSFEAQGPTSSLGGLTPIDNQPIKSNGQCSQVKKSPRQLRDLVDRLFFGLQVTLQSRFPATNWPVKNIPPFYQRDPHYVPSKVAFLIRNSLKCIIYIDLLRLTSRLGNPEDNPILFSQDHVPFFQRLGDISSTELQTRVLGVLGYWTIQYMVISVLYSTLAILAVVLGLSAVSEWPPVFGSVVDSWSLGQFWGCFYHQLVRRGCSSIGHFVFHHCLGLKRGGFLTRYIFITLVFTVSGIFHLLSDIPQQIPMSESGAMQFFCMQGLGIMFEDAIHTLFQKLIGESKNKVLIATKRLGGYIWVVAWLAWTSPIWIYPAMRRDTGTPLVPF